MRPTLIERLVVAALCAACFMIGASISMQCGCITLGHTPQVRVVANQPCLKTDVVFIDDSAGPEVREAARGAVDYWNVAFGREVLVYGGAGAFDEDRDRDPHIRIFLAMTSVLDAKRKVSPLIAGWARSNRVRRYPNRCIYGTRIWYATYSEDTPGDTSPYSTNGLTATIYHEIGHALGLDHSLEYKTLMYYQPSVVNRTLGEDTKAEIERLNRRWVTQ